MRETTLCYIERDGKYLMLCRSPKKKDGSAGKWMGVGGKLEPGETPDECVRREVFEETGLVLTRVCRRGMIYFYSDTWENEVMHLFTADCFEGEVKADCEEGELCWISIDEVMDLPMWEGDRIFLKGLVEGEMDMRIALTYEGDNLVKWEKNYAV